MTYLNGKGGNMINILLVDDNPGDQMLFKEAIEETGIDHKLSFASSTQECLRLIGLQKPDLIFMDVIMPGLSGGDFVRTHYKDFVKWSIPIIFLTGIVDRNQNSEKDNNLNIGGLSFPALGKPVDPKKLIDLIAKIKIH
jgi:putative two-component system response regulator